MSDLFRPLNEGYEFNGNETFSEAWRIFRKQTGSFIGVTVLFCIIIFVVAFIPFVNFTMYFVATSLYGGYFVYLRKMDSGSQELGDFFNGFSHFVKIAKYLLLFFLLLLPGIAIFATMLFMVSDVFSGNTLTNTEDFGGLSPQFPQFNESMGSTIFALVFLYAYFFYLLVSFSFVLPLIVDGKMRVRKAMGLSRKVVGKKFFHFLGFFILFGISSLVLSVFTIGFGYLVVLPMYYIIIWVFYTKIFKIDEEVIDEIDSFGIKTVDINTESQERNLGAIN